MTQSWGLQNACRLHLFSLMGAWWSQHISSLVAPAFQEPAQGHSLGTPGQPGCLGQWTEVIESRCLGVVLPFPFEEICWEVDNVNLSFVRPMLPVASCIPNRWPGQEGPASHGILLPTQGASGGWRSQVVAWCALRTCRPFLLVGGIYYEAHKHLNP